MSELANIRDKYLSDAKNLHEISCDIIQKDSTKITKQQINKYKKNFHIHMMNY